MFTKDSVKNQQIEYAKLHNLPLRELTVKGSYNSAFDGTTFTIQQLGTVMANGCRYIDMQVFSASGGTLYVAHSDTPRANLVDATLSFSEVLGYISQYAFVQDTKITAPLLDEIYQKSQVDGKAKELDTKAGAPIQQTYTDYPLFVNIRVNRSDNENGIDIVEEMYKRYINPESKTPIIPQKFFHRNGKYAKMVDRSTPLDEIKGKIIFVMDIDNIIQNYTTSYNADDVPISVRKYMAKFVNVFIGGHTWKSFNNYSTVENTPVLELYAMDNGLLSNTTNLYISLPNPTDSGNPNAMNMLTKHRIQHIPNRYYIKDANLEKYNKMFDSMKKPFVPMAHALAYFKDTLNT
jgi:hypothetical protein